MLDRIRLTDKQRQLAEDVGIDVDKYIRENDIGGLEQDIILSTSEFDEEGEPLDKTVLYEDLQSDIYMYNEYEDYEPKFK